MVPKHLHWIPSAVLSLRRYSISACSELWFSKALQLGHQNTWARIHSSACTSLPLPLCSFSWGTNATLKPTFLWESGLFKDMHTTLKKNKFLNQSWKATSQLCSVCSTKRQAEANEHNFILLICSKHTGTTFGWSAGHNTRVCSYSDLSFHRINALCCQELASATEPAKDTSVLSAGKIRAPQSSWGFAFRHRVRNECYLATLKDNILQVLSAKIDLKVTNT